MVGCLDVRRVLLGSILVGDVPARLAQERADGKGTGVALVVALALHGDDVHDVLCHCFFSSRRRHTRYWRDWSSDVCSSDLRHLAVFPGGFTLAAAEHVGRSLSPMQGEGGRSVLDLITSLVDKSLLRRLDGNRDEARFGMLATIQEYGLEKLAAAGEGATARQVHATYFLELAEQAWPAFRQRTGQESWLDRLETERASLRAALVWLDESGEAESLLYLAGALSWF